jgi:L-threonylcarbamoyladenylate synthase
VESLRAAIGSSKFRIQDYKCSDNGEPLRSPGQLPKHYSPNARLVLLDWQDDKELRLRLSTFKAHPSKVHVIAHTQIPSCEHLGRVSVLPHDAEAYARALYAELHQCDEAGAELIVVETPPPTAEWQAIADRLRRAAA